MWKWKNCDSSPIILIFRIEKINVNKKEKRRKVHKKIYVFIFIQQIVLVKIL